MSKEELLKGLTKEQIDKVEKCNSQDELLKLAKDEGIELTDEQLQAVSGGGCTSSEEAPNCIYCGSSNTCTNSLYGYSNDPRREYRYRCKDCGKYFNV